MAIKILYVEDDVQQVELVRIVMAKDGIQVVTALDGMSGLAIARSEQPDLILMDINLPGITGIDTAQRIRGLPETAHIPIVALTSNMKLGALQGYMGAIFDAYLQKPVLRQDLLACVRSHVGEISR